MINTPDLVSTLRALYIQNSGAIPADKLFPLLEETHLQMVDMENLFASIISDLSPKQHWVLPYREVNRFLLLQKAIESKESSSVCQEVLPHLHVLKENLNSPDPNCELSMKAAREVRKDILPFAEKLPKLVKALNDYALLCEKYFSDATLLKRLVANIRLLPLADEANKLVEKRAMLFTIDVYWSTAEELYENSLFLFDDHPFNFSVVRAYLDEAVAVNKVPPLEIAVPASLSLPVVLPEEVPEEPVAIEEPVEIAEDPITVVEPPVATASDIVPEKNSPAIEEPITLAKEPMTTVLPEESASLQQPASSQQPRMDAKSDRVPPPARLRKQIIIISTCLMAIIVLGGGIFFFFKNQNAPEERSLSTPIVLEPVVQELIRDTTRLAAPSSDDTRSTSEKAQPTEFPNNRVNSAGKSQEMKNLPAKEEMKLGQKAVELKGSDPKTTAPKSADSKSSDPKMADSKTVEPKAANPKAADPQNVKPESSEASKKPELSKDKETPTTPATNVSSAAFDALLTKAKGGNAAAQYQVGQYYEKGTGVKADLFEALTWYRKAKVNGSEPATQRLMELGY